MAKINVEFDTGTKEMVVTMDGKAVANVEQISLSRGNYYAENPDEAYGCSILTLVKNEEESYKAYTQIIASDTNAGKQAIADGAGAHPEFPGFVALNDAKSAINDEVSRLFKNRRPARRR